MLPELTTHDALFLDLDGTLIEIAPTPSGVVIPKGLVRLLHRLAERLDGAVAILTGRSIEDLDHLLVPFAPVAAGIHGAEFRSEPQGKIESRAGPIDAQVTLAVHDVADQNTGVLVEMKHATIAVHFRQVPTLAPRIEAALARILEVGPDHLMLTRGRQVFEIVPRHVSKGAALDTIMRLPAFTGRRPIMIGDDAPDISAFEAAIRQGGKGLTVAGEQFPFAEADFPGPTEVRAWLAASAEGLTS